MNRIGILIIGFILVIATISCTKEPEIQKEPIFSTTDIDLFWKVIDENKPDFDGDFFKTNYVNNGSIGLKDFDDIKNICPDLESKLKQEKYLQYYNSIRNNTLDLTNEITISKNGYVEFENTYSGFKPTDIYFLIGALTAGGKQTDNGLMIAVEFFTKTDSTSVEKLSNWYQSVIKEKKYIPSVVIHELAHFQQNYIPKNNGYSTLLEQSIREGMADYISYSILNDKPFLNEHLHEYAESIEQELWIKYENEMNLNFKETGWLYNGGESSRETPADLGYYVGFKIIESFSSNFNGDSEAIKAMLSNSDYYDIFEKSNYKDKFQ